MKAILIIDMPKDCWDCPCNWGDVMCNMEAGFKHDLPDKGRLENCPLKPIPEWLDIERAIDDVNKHALYISKVKAAKMTGEKE